MIFIRLLMLGLFFLFPWHGALFILHIWYLYRLKPSSYSVAWFSCPLIFHGGQLKKTVVTLAVQVQCTHVDHFLTRGYRLQPSSISAVLAFDKL